MRLADVELNTPLRKVDAVLASLDPEDRATLLGWLESDMPAETISRRTREWSKIEGNAKLYVSGPTIRTWRNDRDWAAE